MRILVEVLHPAHVHVFRCAIGEWRARGDEVDIIDDGRVTASGRVVEVDTIGRLVLATGGGSRAINVGDVSLRRAESQR